MKQIGPYEFWTVQPKERRNRFLVDVLFRVVNRKKDIALEPVPNAVANYLMEWCQRNCSRVRYRGWMSTQLNKPLDMSFDFDGWGMWFEKEDDAVLFAMTFSGKP